MTEHKPGIGFVLLRAERDGMREKLDERSELSYLLPVTCESEAKIKKETILKAGPKASSEALPEALPEVAPEATPKAVS